MLLNINSFQFTPSVNYIKNAKISNKQNNSQVKFATSLNTDTVCFTGKSAPSMYKSVFEYLAAEIIGGNKKFQVDGSMLSASKIKDAVDDLAAKNKLFHPFKDTVPEKIKWKSYIPQDVRVFSVDKINQARAVRMEQWKEFLQNPEKVSPLGQHYDSELVSKIKDDNPLKFVIWNAVSGEIKSNNRHIPVPFNEKALLETIRGFETIEPKDRAVRCAAPSFLEIYTHRLRDNLLMDMNLSDRDSVWVKIPSLKHDSANQDKNIQKLEILSCRNWCTRSSVDKAKDALDDGDFYIYLERGKFNLWEPLVGMTTTRGKIDQIQGVENNNIVPLNLVDEIKNFIKKNNIQCYSGIVDEGPKARQAILISEKLNETMPELKKSFAKAIKEKDDVSMLKYLGVNVNTLPDNTLEISGYKPSYNIKSDSGISIPYSMFGLNEDDLLQNVKTIHGNLILDNKNPLFNSRITQFPPKLENVTGRVSCTAEQFAKYKDDIMRVVGNNQSKVIVHST